MSRLTGNDAKNLREAYSEIYAPQELTEEQIWQEVETWVNSLLEEGYDLSEYTWEEMYEAYLSEIPVPPTNPRGTGVGSGYNELGLYQSTSDGRQYVSYDAARRAHQRRLGQQQGQQRPSGGGAPQPSGGGGAPAAPARPSVAAAGGAGGRVTVGQKYAATQGGVQGSVTYDAQGKKTFTPAAGAVKPAPAGQTGDKEAWAKANPRLAEVERLRQQQRDAGKSTFDPEFRKNVINPVMYDKGAGGGRSVADSQKMNPPAAKPTSTLDQATAAAAKPAAFSANAASAAPIATPYSAAAQQQKAAPSAARQPQGLPLGSARERMSAPAAPAPRPAAAAAPATSGSTAPAPATTSQATAATTKPDTGVAAQTAKVAAQTTQPAVAPTPEKKEKPVEKTGVGPTTGKPTGSGSGAPLRSEPLWQHFDLFDVIKGHLLDEGYADTEEAALVIMSNMSEEWRQSILEQNAIVTTGTSTNAAGEKIPWTHRTNTSTGRSTVTDKYGSRDATVRQSKLKGV